MQEISKVSNICQSKCAKYCAEVQTVNSASFTRALSPMLANNPSISLDASGNLHLRLSCSSPLALYKVLQCSSDSHLCIFLLFASVFALCPASNELGPQETAQLSTAHVVLAACHGVASKHSQKCRNMSADFPSSSRVNFCTTPNSPNCSPSWPDLGAHHLTRPTSNC